MSSTSLCPGYTQVHEFGPDEEYDTEEVLFVTLDLGNVEPTLVPTSSSYRLIGLDSPTPFLQLSGTVFKGQHESLLGTELLFTDGKDDHDRSKRCINPVVATERRVRFREVRLNPKNATPGKDTPATSKWKEKERDKENPDHQVAPAIPDIPLLDRMTGLSKPIPRSAKNSKGKKASAKRQESVVENADTLAMVIHNDDGHRQNDDAMDMTEG